MVTIRIRHAHPVTGRRIRTTYEVVIDATQEVAFTSYSRKEAYAAAETTREHLNAVPLPAAA